MSNNTGNTLLAVLAGAVVGAGIGVLFAPDKGSKTRKKIKDGFEHEKDHLKEKWNGIAENLKSKISNAKHDLESEFDQLLSQTDHKKEEVIEALEKKLAELKKHAEAAKK